MLKRGSSAESANLTIICNNLETGRNRIVLITNSIVLLVPLYAFLFGETAAH